MEDIGGRMVPDAGRAGFTGTLTSGREGLGRPSFEGCAARTEAMYPGGATALSDGKVSPSPRQTLFS